MQTYPYRAQNNEKLNWSRNCLQEEKKAFTLIKEGTFKKRSFNSQNMLGKTKAGVALGELMFM